MSAAKTAPALPKTSNRTFVPISTIRPDPDQPRKVFDETKLKELAENIRENGVVQDLIVRYRPGARVIEPDMIEKNWRAIEDGTGLVLATGSEKEAKAAVKGKEEGFYEIMEGERRWRASQLAGLKELPVTIRQIDDKAKLVLQLITSQQREALSALEEAATYAKAIESGQHTIESLYKSLSISRGTLFSRLVLNRLHPPVRVALVEGAISVSVAGLVAQVPTVDLQAKLLAALTNKQSYQYPYSFREAEKLISETFMRQLRQAPFKLDQVYSGVIAGRTGIGCQLMDVPTCQDCPRRSGNMKEAFPDLKNLNICTDVPCYEAKVFAENDRKIDAAHAAGQTAIERDQSKKLFDDYGEHSTLREASGYIDLAERCEPIGYQHKQHWRATLGKHCPTPILAEAPDGTLHELLKKQEALDALKAAGRKIEQRGSGMGDGYRREQAKRREKQKRMLRAAHVATAAILAKFANGSLNDKLWAFIAQAAYDTTSIDCHAFVAKRRGLTKVQTDAREKLEKFLKDTKDPMELARFSLEVLVCGRYGGFYTSGYNKTFQALAELAGVDLKKAEEAPEAPGKKTPTPPPKSKK